MVGGSGTGFACCLLHQQLPAGVQGQICTGVGACRGSGSHISQATLEHTLKTKSWSKLVKLSHQVYLVTGISHCTCY